MKLSSKILVAIFLISTTLFSQSVVNVEFPVSGQITLTPQISIPKINKGYTLWIPSEGNVNGLVVFTHARRDTVNNDSFIEFANKNQLGVLYATTENRLEFLFDPEKLQEIENYINEVITMHHIPQENLLYCGMSLEGTRAAKLSIYGQSPASKHKIVPKAIAICDSPLDMVRFHKEAVKSKELNFNPIAANEGAWVSEYLESSLGGAPRDTLSVYIDYSPYSYSANGEQYVPLFKEIAVRAYTEPDVNWWIETRRKDYYSMNSIDLAAFVNELKIIGNSRGGMSLLLETKESDLTARGIPIVGALLMKRS